MKVFFDCEFLERGPELPIKLISIGMVREDDKTLYLINLDMQLSIIVNSPWIQTDVLPHLPIKVSDRHLTIMNSVVEWDGDHPDIHRVVTQDAIVAAVKEFLTEYDHEEWGKPELWTYYGAYNHVVLTQLFGSLADLPAGIPAHSNDLVQEWNRLGQPAILPPQPSENRAIDDALWNQEAFRELGEYAYWPNRVTNPSAEDIESFRSWQNR